MTSTAEKGTCFVQATDPSVIEALAAGTWAHITNLSRANDIRDFNEFFRVVNQRLPVGGTYCGSVRVCEQLKLTHFSGRAGWMPWVSYLLFFLYRRVLPKLKLTRTLYAVLSRGRGHAFSKAEVLGRLVYCGFDIVSCNEIGTELHFVVEKRRTPSESPPSPCGPLFKMRRVVQGGEVRVFYKLRTMHPYAEHIQAYVYETNNLEPSGKIRGDFRVTTWGRFLRRTWLDELPMLLNLLKRDLKIVGVRPLSEHYLSLYPPELRELRLRHKPGLVPPFYADLPEGLDAIFESERRYLEAYERHPLKTDLRYLVLALRRIVLERARSQ